MANGKRALKRGIIDYLGEGGFPRGISLEEMGFNETLTPEAGGLLSSAFGQAQQYADNPMQVQRDPATMGAISRMMSGEATFNADPAMRERYFQQAISDPAWQQFNQQVAPQIAARYGRGGNLGAAAYATGQAGQQLTGMLSGQRAGLLREDEVMAEQSRQAAMQRMGQGAALSLGQQQFDASFGADQRQMGLGNLAQFGEMERGIRGQGIQERLQRVLAQQPFNDPRLGLYQMLGVQPPARPNHQDNGQTWYGAAASGLGSALGFG